MLANVNVCVCTVYGVQMTKNEWIWLNLRLKQQTLTKTGNKHNLFGLNSLPPCGPLKKTIWCSLSISSIQIENRFLEKFCEHETGFSSLAASSHSEHPSNCITLW